MGELLARIKDFLSLGAKQVLIVFVAAWLLLLLPEDLLRSMGLADLRNQFRPWIGLLAVLASSWLATLMLYDIGTSARRRISLWFEIRDGQNLLENLTPPEKGYLALYLGNETPTQTFRISDGIALGLQAKGILYRPSSVGRVFDEFDFNIQPWAYRALKANPSLLAGAAAPARGFRRFS